MKTMRKERGFDISDKPPSYYNQNGFEKIYFNGWVKKKRGNMLGWVNRWVVIGDRSIKYYRGPKGKIRKEINLDHIACMYMDDKKEIIIGHRNVYYHFKIKQADQYHAMCMGINTGIERSNSVHGEFLNNIKQNVLSITWLLKNGIGLLDREGKQLKYFKMMVAQCVMRLKEVHKNLNEQIYQCKYRKMKLNNLEENKDSDNINTTHESNVSPLSGTNTTSISVNLSSVVKTSEKSDISHQDVKDDLNLAEYESYDSQEFLLPCDNEPKEKNDMNDVEVIDANIKRSKKMAPLNLSIIKLLKDAIGKDLCSFTLPLTVNEPLSALQRLCEEIKYYEILSKLVDEPNPVKRMIIVSVFAITGYTFTYKRPRKPFNPLLGETFTYKEGKMMFVAEKVNHRPLEMVSAFRYKLGNYTIEYVQNVLPMSSLRGTSVVFNPKGKSILKVSDDEVYEWNRVSTTLGGILTNSVRIDHYGTMEINRKNSKLVSRIKFISNSGLFHFKPNNEIIGEILDDRKDVIYTLEGRWSHYITGKKPNDIGEVLWELNGMKNIFSEYYGFSEYTMKLNNKIYVDWPLLNSDTRNREDIRLYEEGRIHEAQNKKTFLEERQRQRYGGEKNYTYNAVLFEKQRDHRFLIEDDGWKRTGLMCIDN